MLSDMIFVKSLDLKEVDPLDIAEAVMEIEQSFGITFNDNEDFKNVTNFEELCSVVIRKVELSYEHVNDCTSQQAFYKLRNSISSVFNISETDLLVDTRIGHIFPGKKRRKNIQQLEHAMGFKSNLLRFAKWLSTTMLLFTLVSLILMFVKWQIGIPAFAASIAIWILIRKYSKTFYVKTLGEAAEKLTKENYRNSRRNPETINKAEVSKTIREILEKQLSYYKLRLPV